MPSDLLTSSQLPLTQRFSSPLGVPSRMNIGQVLEVNLGYAAKACGIKVMTPVFDSAREADIGDTFDTAREMWHGENAPAYPTKLPKLMGEKGHIIDFSKIELDRDGKTTVYDGRTGEKFDNRVTVQQLEGNVGIGCNFSCNLYFQGMFLPVCKTYGFYARKVLLGPEQAGRGVSTASGR